MVSLGTLINIISDFAPRSLKLSKVGLIGSYARNEQSSDSDVDMVFMTPDGNIDEPLIAVAMPIRSVLLNQFRVGLDVVNYRTILNRANAASDLYFQDGYKQMLRDLRWVWEGNARSESSAST